MNILNFRQQLFVLIAFASLFLLNTACENSPLSSSKKEGLIEFDTKGVDPKHPLYGFAPSSATLKFKEEKFSIEMSIMGMFNTTIIADNTKKSMAQTVKFLDIKQACVERGAELDEDNSKYALKIEETSETKDIIGFKCHKIRVSKVGDPTDHFDAWYTKELGTEDVNALTPYAAVKGMLMDYRVERMGMELHFLAKKYEQIEIPDKSFEIPASMKIVSRPEMEQFIEGLQ